MNTRMLPVRLTSEELRERGAELAGDVTKLRTKEEEAKEEAKARKKEIDKVKGRVIDLARVVSEKREDRPVEVIERFDVVGRLVLEIRTDTGEQIGSRPMTPAEFAEHGQRTLEFVPGGAGIELTTKAV